MPYKGRTFNPAAISVRLEYSATLGMTLDAGDGALTITPTGVTGGKQKLIVKNRGAYDGMNDGEYVVQEFSITVNQKNQTLTQSDAARLEDFFRMSGYFAGATSLADVDGVFRVIVTYADKSTRTFAICEGEMAESHAFPTNTLALTIRSHGGDTVANL